MNKYEIALTEHGMNIFKGGNVEVMEKMLISIKYI